MSLWKKFHSKHDLPVFYFSTGLGECQYSFARLKARREFFFTGKTYLASFGAEHCGACRQRLPHPSAEPTLSPTVVEAILDGKYTAHLTMKDLMKPLTMDIDFDQTQQAQN